MHQNITHKIFGIRANISPTMTENKSIIHTICFDKYSDKWEILFCHLSVKIYFCEEIVKGYTNFEIYEKSD